MKGLCKSSKNIIFLKNEQVMVFIVFMIFRVGGPAETNHLFGWGLGDIDFSIFGIMTSVGYFYFIIILLVGIAMGDNNKFTVNFSLYSRLDQDHSKKRLEKMGRSDRATICWSVAMSINLPDIQ